MSTVHRERLEKAGWTVGGASEFLGLGFAPEFWKMIEARRASGKVLSQAEVRRRLGMPKRGPSTRRR